jgi:hypothetical protein
MKQAIYCLILLMNGWSFLYAQDNVWHRISTSVELEPFTTGYMNATGDTVIPVGKYVYCNSETFDKIAFVTLKDPHSHGAMVHGNVAINREGKVLFEVVFSDTKPDAVCDGLFRIKKNEKIGFANMQGEIIIKPQYDEASPFFDGYAAVCFGGKLDNEYEMSKRIGGKWGFINKSGTLIVKPIYDEVRNIKAGEAKVKKDGEWTVIKIN